MKRQLTLSLVAATLLLLLPGCPGAVSAIVGSWIITTGGIDRGLQLNANGEAIPFTVDSLLLGTFTWEIDGTRVLIHQESGPYKWVWAAELMSETTMEGAWVAWTGSIGNSSTWTAVKQ